MIKAKFKTPRDTTRPNNKGKVKRVENEVFFITNDFDMPIIRVTVYNTKLLGWCT